MQEKQIVLKKQAFVIQIGNCPLMVNASIAWAYTLNKHIYRLLILQNRFLGMVVKPFG
jgi:hypothetical protein